MVTRVAALSRWHVHADEYARAIGEHPDAELVAIWDEVPERGAAWAQELALPFEADLVTLLACADVDAVLVTTPTNMHRDVMIAAANAGKHIFTEKVLAVTLADARAIAAAVRSAGVHFCISFPRQTIAPLRLAKQLIDDGEIGRPTMLRIRIAHDGALKHWLPEHFYDPQACGGGAMIDLGAHGMYLANWLLGAPARVSSVFNSLTQRAVEDNCVSVIEFLSGAIAINETSFVSGGGAFSLEIDGTDGGLRMTAPRDPIMVRSGRGADVRVWTARECPRSTPRPIAQWLAGLAGESDPSCNASEFGVDVALQLTAMMEAAYLSHREQRTVAMTDVTNAAH